MPPMLFRPCLSSVSEVQVILETIEINQERNSGQASISKGFVFVSGNIGCTNDFKVVEGGVQPQTVSEIMQSRSIVWRLIHYLRSARHLRT